jgi:hypothetical protein
MISTRSITIRRLRFTSLFKLALLGHATLLAPICVLSGLLSAFGFDVLKSGNGYAHGLSALGSALIASVVIPVTFAILTTLSLWPGLWLFSRFRDITLEVVEPRQQQ